MDYISWIEDTYPQLGEQSDIIPVLERSTRALLQDKYKEDPRYLSLWLKYADMCINPVDIYPYLFKNGIGVNNAKLYIEWATFLEESGDSQSADKVIDKGINLGAKPFDLMKKAQGHFQQRFMLKIKEQMLKKSEPTNQPQRKTLGTISNEEAKTGKRVLSTISSQAPSLKITKVSNTNVSSKKSNFIIFDEESKETKNDRISFDILGSTKTNPFLPTEKEKIKENTGITEKWTSHQLKGQKMKAPKIQFSIFQDEESFKNDEEEEMKDKIHLKQTSNPLFEELRRNPLKFAK